MNGRQPCLPGVDCGGVSPGGPRALLFSLLLVLLLQRPGLWEELGQEGQPGGPAGSSTEVPHPGVGAEASLRAAGAGMSRMELGEFIPE